MRRALQIIIFDADYKQHQELLYLYDIFSHIWARRVGHSLVDYNTLYCQFSGWPWNADVTPVVDDDLRLLNPVVVAVDAFQSHVHRHFTLNIEPLFSFDTATACHAPADCYSQNVKIHCFTKLQQAVTTRRRSILCLCFDCESFIAWQFQNHDVSTCCGYREWFSWVKVFSESETAVPIRVTARCSLTLWSLISDCVSSRASHIGL